ncbi:MAG: IS66 family transposase [Planctomycetota bacterium]
MSPARRPQRISTRPGGRPTRDGVAGGRGCHPRLFLRDPPIAWPTWLPSPRPRSPQGVFTSERRGVYRERAVRFRQLYWAHLLRHYEKLVDRGGESAEIGRKAKDIETRVFTLSKDFQAGLIDRETLKQCLRPLKEGPAAVLTEALEVADPKTVHVSENLLALEPAICSSARSEEVEPTNNHAERLLRQGVLSRKGSFGNSSDAGFRFVERILTVVQTRRLQKQPVLGLLREAVRAHRAGKPAPCLVSA